MTDLRDAVRALHKPSWYGYMGAEHQVWLVCRGCDEGSHCETPPGWPCRTADLVYDAEEISAREPHVAECPADHRTHGEGPPARAQAIFVMGADGNLTARRFLCDHVAPVPVTSADPWD